MKRKSRELMRHPVALAMVASVLLMGCARRKMVKGLDENPVGSMNTAKPVVPASPASPSSTTASSTRTTTASPRPKFNIDLSTPAVGKSVQLKTADGVTIVGSWSAPKDASQPSLILLHMLTRQRHDWDGPTTELQKSGYGVLSIDLRGHGVSVMRNGQVISFKQFSAADFNNMVLDVAAAVDFVKSQEGVNRDAVALVGASIGANVALSYAASHPDIKAVVLLSPGLDYRGVKTEGAMKKYGGRPVLFMASSEDGYAADSAKKLATIGGKSGKQSTGKQKSLMLRGVGHGTDMLMSRPSLLGEITAFLQGVFAAPKVTITPQNTAAQPPKKVKGM